MTGASVESWSRAQSTADLDRAGLDALADFFPLDPACTDDKVEVIFHDRDRGEEQRVHLDFARTAGEFHYTGNFAHLLAVRQQQGDLGRLPAELARILPHRDSLGAKRDAVERGVIAVLAGNRHGAGHALRR